MAGVAGEAPNPKASRNIKNTDVNIGRRLGGKKGFVRNFATPVSFYKFGRVVLDRYVPRSSNEAAITVFIWESEGKYLTLNRKSGRSGTGQNGIGRPFLGRRPNPRFNHIMWAVFLIVVSEVIGRWQESKTRIWADYFGTCSRNYYGEHGVACQ